MDDNGGMILVGLILFWVGVVVFGKVIVPAILAHLVISLAILIGGPLAALGGWLVHVWWDERRKDRELKAAQEAEKARWEAIYANKQAQGLVQLNREFAKNQAETASWIKAARAETTPDDDAAGPLDAAA